MSRQQNYSQGYHRLSRQLMAINNLDALQDSMRHLTRLRDIIMGRSAIQTSLRQRDADNEELLDNIEKETKELETAFNGLAENLRAENRGLSEIFRSFHDIVHRIRNMKRVIDNMRELFKKKKQQFQILPQVSFVDSPISMQTLETFLDINYDLEALEFLYLNFKHDYPWVNTSRFEQKLNRMIIDVRTFEKKTGTNRLYLVYRETRLIKTRMQKFQQDFRNRQKKTPGDLQQMIYMGQNLRRQVRLDRKTDIEIILRQQITDNPIVQSWLRRQSRYLTQALNRLNDMVPSLQSLAQRRQQQKMRRRD